MSDLFRPPIPENISEPYDGLAPSHRKYGASVHQVPVHWRLRNVDRIAIGPRPRLILSARARRDVELLFLRIDFLEFLYNPDMKDVSAETVLVDVPHVTGLRRLKPEGEPHVWGQENVDAAPMFGGKPEDAADQPEQIRWYGGTVDLIEYNRDVAPNDYWVWRGRILIPKGKSVGLIVRASVPTCCRAQLAGT